MSRDNEVTNDCVSHKKNIIDSVDNVDSHSVVDNVVDSVVDEIIDSVDENFKCVVCNKIFSRKHALKEHRRRNTCCYNAKYV